MLTSKEFDNLLNEDKKLVFYKGISEYGGLNNWPVREVGESGIYYPGFVSTYKLARVYSQPTLTGDQNDNSMIIKVEIDASEIEDRTDNYQKWCNENGVACDVSVRYPKDWKDDGSIWTVCNSGSAHSDNVCYGKSSFVYVAKKMPYEVVAYYNNEDEWSEG